MANKRLRRPLKAVNSALHEILMDACRHVPGDFMEFGVWKGESFAAIYEWASCWQRRVHAVDTFCGFPLSPIDADNLRYPPGEADAGGVDGFRETYPRAVIHEGVVPDILADIQVHCIAFAHLDIDHEHSTRAALEWIWPRMTHYGILIVHDFGLDVEVHASKAVKDWMCEHDLDYIGITDNTIFFRKGIS